MIVMFLLFYVFRVYGGVIVGSAIRSHDDSSVKLCPHRKVEEARTRRIRMLDKRVYNCL